MRGRGILSARTGGGWSSPTFMTLTGGSIGLQIGGQAADLVLIIMNRRGLEQFVRNQFKFGADASAAAGPVGRDAQVTTDLQLRAEILSYSRARGLFAGVTDQRQHGAGGPRCQSALLREAARRTANRAGRRERRVAHAGAGVDPDAEPPHSALRPRYFVNRSSMRSATVLSTLIRAKFLSFPSMSVQGAIFVLVRATISLTATV